MARWSVATSKTTGAAAGIIAELRTAAARDARIWEIGIFAESAAAGTVVLVRSGGAGTTPGGAVVPVPDDFSVTATASENLYTTYATEPTTVTTPLRRIALPATIGAGVIWTFPEGIVVPVSAGLMIRQVSTVAVTYGVNVNYEG